MRGPGPQNFDADLLLAKRINKAGFLAPKATFRRGIYKSARVRRLVRWFNAVRYPPLAVEITPDRVSLVRWSHRGSVEGLAVEALPAGAVVPSAVESNIVDLPGVQAALERACDQLDAREGDAALLVPDPVIRVLVQHFEEFPRSRQEALPLLRWKLKKSVPFDVEEILLSYVRQAPREKGVNVVTALARVSVVRGYEDVLRAAKLRPGMVLSSSIAAAALLEDERPTLLVRITGSALTTAIVRGDVLCSYRCADLPMDHNKLTPGALLEEIFPVAAYYQDTWQEAIQLVKIAGMGDRLPEFLSLFEEEFHCPVNSLLQSAIFDGRIPEDARSLADHELEGLLGWMRHRA